MESLQFVGCSWFIGLIGLVSDSPKIKFDLKTKCALPCSPPVSSSIHLDAPGVHSTAGYVAIPPYLASHTHGHCRKSSTGLCEAGSSRLQLFTEHRATEFTERPYIQSTPMYRSPRSTQHPHPPTGRTRTPSISENPDEPLLHV